MRRLSSVGFALLVVGACSGRATRYPPPRTAPGPGPVAVPVGVNPEAVAPSVIVPGPPPPPVTFSELPTLAFKKGASLKLTPVVKGVYHLYALSPDTKSWIASAPQTPDGKKRIDEGTRFFSPAFPDGMKIEAWVPSATFYPDGSRVLVWSFGNGALAVVDANSGKTLYERTAAVCNARFDGPDQIVFHESSKDPDAHLWRVKISTGQAMQLGGARVADYCEANADGSAWIAYLDDTRVYVDGKTGATLPIQPPANAQVKLSAGANRYCLPSESGLSCVRLPDGGVEQVWSRPTSEYMDFDPEGQHALIRYVRNVQEGVYDGWAYVDFVARTVRPLTGFKATTGSTFEVHPNGKLISIGSSRGVYIYDMERGVLRFAPHNELYDNLLDRNFPRRIVIGTDGVEDIFYVDVP
jgi:hypothetical protein